MPREAADVKKQRQADFASTFGTESGQKVLRNLMAFCNLWSQTTIDPDQLLFAEGQRSVILYILEEMRQSAMDPAKFIENVNQSAKDYDPLAGA
jgi:hypothetical protein